MYWEQDKECMDREDLEQLQLERLESTLTRVQMNVPFYRRKFEKMGIDTDTIRSLDDLRSLPFTTNGK
jgi:phenylacetate-CoA ligase